MKLLQLFSVKTRGISKFLTVCSKACAVSVRPVPCRGDSDTALLDLHFNKHTVYMVGFYKQKLTKFTAVRGTKNNVPLKGAGVTW